MAERLPGKPVIVTEAGWTTRSNGRGVPVENASPASRPPTSRSWTAGAGRRGVLTFVFEAFDEAWKGSADPHEPEKHWGLFTADRRPKPAAQPLYPDLLPAEAPP